jgi:hypothetical protein
MRSSRDEYLWEGGSAHSSGKGYLGQDVEQSPQTWLEMIALLVILLGQFEFHFRRMVVIQPRQISDFSMCVGIGNRAQTHRSQSVSVVALHSTRHPLLS